MVGLDYCKNPPIRPGPVHEGVSPSTRVPMILLVNYCPEVLECHLATTPMRSQLNASFNTQTN